MKMPTTSIDQLTTTPGICWTALSDVKSHGNLGTLVRTSAAAHGAGFILFGTNVDPFDPAVIRASMGAWFRQRFVVTTWREFGRWQETHGWSCIGATPESDVCFRDARYAAPTIFMLGTERKGLSSRQREACHQLVRIPMNPESDSLNVAIAGSLMIYEAQRQAAIQQGHGRRPVC